MDYMAHVKVELFIMSVLEELTKLLSVQELWEILCLQRPLNTRPVQYLGKISFALYSLHETIYERCRYPLRDLIYIIPEPSVIPDTTRLTATGTAARIE